MAHTCSIPTHKGSKHTSCISQRRRELFPSNDDDSDDLGHISPLSDSTPSDSPISSPRHTEYRIAEHNLSNFNKSSITDYVILENIREINKNDLLTASLEIVEDPLEDILGRTPLRLNTHNGENSMSPLYLSPVQLAQSPVVSSPKKYKLKVSETNGTPSRKFPMKTFETPEDSFSTNSHIPKLIRSSCSDNSEGGKRKMPFSTTPPVSKHPKLDQGSKVRTVLFPKPEAAVPAMSFYSKSGNYHVPRVYKNKEVERKKVRHKSSSLYICGQRGRKKRFGQINSGVMHKIKKPKPKKIAQAQLLTAALNILDYSPLNNFLNSLNKSTTCNESGKHQYELPVLLNSEIQNCVNDQGNDDSHSDWNLNIKKENESQKRERSVSPDPTKKFFKFKRSAATFTIDKHRKLKVDDGKLSLLESQKSHKKRKTDLRVKLDVTDLTAPENESLISPEKIDRILFNLDDNNDKENDDVSVCTVNIDKRISDCAEQFILRAHNSVSMSENAIHLHVPCELQRSQDRNLNLNCSLLPSQSDEKSVLLSPTSQMCNMTLGLALNSPKKAKQNITNILNKNVNSAFNEISAVDVEQEKLYPIFYGVQKLPPRNLKAPKSLTSRKLKPLPKNQMLLDAGQKHFGATQCSECKFVYHMGDPGDELMHLNYHNAGNILRFNGWKDERIVAEFPNARIIRILPSDPKPWLRKVKDLLDVVNRDLGYYEMPVDLNDTQVYLYIKNKTIAGCLVAEPKTTAYRLLSEDVGIDLCSETSYPVKCGVSRIWVSQAHRREGVGTSLLNSLRGNFMYGTILTKADIAFSSPTEAGKVFAAKYFNTINFLVYT